MPFPSDKELKAMRAKLEKVEPVRVLPKNASEVDKVKYAICRKFVLHLRKTKLTQKQLAKKLKIDPARMNEIVKYRIELFTIDKLISIAEGLDEGIKLKVA